jgi:uncharacterized protein with beta-barrel porin domain
MEQFRIRQAVRFGEAACAFLFVLGASVAIAQTAPQAAAQGRRAEAGGAADPSGQYSVAEVQQMFDALTLMQAEQTLQLSERQFPDFVLKLRALQQQRRRYQQERRQLIQQLVRLTAPAAAASDDARITDRLKALADLDQRASVDLRAAYEAVDQVLSVRQQARFRILEEQVERRKFDLLARARRGALDSATPTKKPIK